MADRFVWRPTRQSSGENNFSVRRAQFGDGYAQSSADGINSSKRTWSMEFSYKKNKISLIDSFLNSHVGTSFIWNDPFYGDGYFYCDTYKVSPQGADIYTLTATFEQTYQP